LLSSDDVMIRGDSLGYNYGSMQHFMAALTTLSARATIMSSVPLVSLPSWQWLWAMKPVFRNWYVMGQVSSDRFARKLDYLNRDHVLINCCIK